MLIRTQPVGLGYLSVQNPDKPHFEADTYTCTHCSSVVIMNPARVRERYKCTGCNHHICDACTALRTSGGQCKTMLQRFEQDMEELHKNPRKG